MILIFIVIFLYILYAGLIFFYWAGWRAIPVFERIKINDSVRISVLIPARNEENNIAQLLSALETQTYPKDLLEVIVINDHSTDNTSAIAKKFPGVIVLELGDEETNSYKKKSIETGIVAATGDLVVTTDADCIPGSQWLETIASFKSINHSVFIAAPVKMFMAKNNLLSAFQVMDFLVLQGITAASASKKLHSMCNGANIAYEKKAFNLVRGFEHIDKIASGDDMLLMQKIRKRFPAAVHYLLSKDAIVSTPAMPTWSEFIDQRIRWTSKTAYYKEKGLIAILLLVYLFNLSFLILFVAGFWNYIYWFCLLGLLFLKTITEFPFVYSVAKFFSSQSLVKYFLLFQPLHIAYTIIAGFLGQLGKYTWKGRIVK